MFKRLRLKIKKQRELEGMKKYQNVLTSWNTKREIESEHKFFLHRKSYEDLIE